ncbi:MULTISPECIES: hypothetical protein [unclassified Marinovum]
MTTDQAIKTATAVVAAAGFLFGVYQFLQTQAIAAATPYLQKQLTWCEEAVETTAAIATATPPDPADVARFWQMYWGVMVLIEDEAIERTMVAFGRDLDPGDQQPKISAEVGQQPPNLPRRALAVARACRTSLARDWSSAWTR